MCCQCEFQFVLHLLGFLTAYECRRMMCMYTLASLILCAQQVASCKCFSYRNQWYDSGNIERNPTGTITGCRFPNSHFGGFFFRFCSSRCEVLELSHQPTIKGRLVAACNRILCAVFFAGPGNSSIDFQCKLGGMLSHSFLPFELLL
jgi:hypothetical protein